MESILKEIDKVRQKLKKGATDTLLLKKPFALGMYYFSMFMLNYYSRVREQLKLDYDSFMIVQTVVSHSLYHLNKTNNNESSTYSELEKKWEKEIEVTVDILQNFKPKKNMYKLTISSICLVTSLPKETVRRKTNELAKKKLLKVSKKQGILLGPQYKKVFQEFVPETTLQVAKLLKQWEKTGILKNMLRFNT